MKKKTNAKEEKASKKKTRVYECFHYEAEYDDLGKYYWCHNRDIPGHECNVGRGFYCQKFCPGYKKGRLCGTWVLSDWEMEEAEEFKKKIEQERKDKETEERALLKYLKEKYES